MPRPLCMYSRRQVRYASPDAEGVQGRQGAAAADIEWESFIAAPVRLTAIRRVFALSGEYRHNTDSSSLPRWHQQHCSTTLLWPGRAK